MKKLIVLGMLVLLLSGCGEYDVDMMLCQKLNDSYRYEIQYKDDDLRNITVVRTWNYAAYNDEYYEQRLAEAKARKKELNKVSGLSMDYTVDEKIVITKVVIDYQKYDLEKDEQSVMPLDLYDENFESIESIREVFIHNDFECDQIVEK